MSSRPIPTRWDDIEAFLIPLLSAEFSPVPVRNIKPKQSGAHKCIVIRGDLQQKVTPISRYARIGIQGWSVTDASESDLSGAWNLAADAGAFLESLPVGGASPLLVAEVDSGPVRVVDSESKLEYQYLTVLAEIHAQ